MSLVVPAVLPTSRKDLEEKLALLATIQTVSRVQIDVVDGQFATPASWPYTTPDEFRAMVTSGKTLPHLDKIEYEIDLMCSDAENVVGDWLTLGTTRLTLHVESSTYIASVIARLRRKYSADTNFATRLVSFGIALNIDTDLARVEQCLDNVEYVQFMGIKQIGQQGQEFDPEVLARVRAFRDKHQEIALQVDGGISLEHAHDLIATGVTNLVVGSAILRASDPIATVAEFEALRSPYGV